MQGRFFRYDLMTTDPGSAQRFYRDVVGWGTQDSGAPGADYTLFTVDGRGVAGLMPIPEEAGNGVPPRWMGYVAVDDVDRMAERLRCRRRAHRGRRRNDRQ